MTRRTLACALLAGTMLAAPAAAEPLRMAQAAPGMLPAYEIETIVRSAGFVPVSPVMRRGEIYVLRASARDGREMRLTVEGRRGRILSATPIPDEVAMPGVRLGPYERISPPGYIDPSEPDVEVGRLGPPVVIEGDRPLIYDRRPAEPIPGPPGTRLGARDPGPDIDAPPPIMREEGGLPPPPERFPQRVGPGAAPKPAAKPAPAKPAADRPAPVKRAAAGPPPLPKPKPAAATSEPPSKQGSWESQAAEGQAAPPAAAPDKPAAAAPAPAKTDPRALPH